MCLSGVGSWSYCLEHVSCLRLWHQSHRCHCCRLGSPKIGKLLSATSLHWLCPWYQFNGPQGNNQLETMLWLKWYNSARMPLKLCQLLKYNQCLSQNYSGWNLYLESTLLHPNIGKKLQHAWTTSSTEVASSITNQLFRLGISPLLCMLSIANCCITSKKGGKKKEILEVQVILRLVCDLPHYLGQ